MIKKYLKTAFSDRTKRANINILISFFFRGASIFLSFILVPLTIGYIKSDAYGIWLTLTSLVGWVAMFDIGIANGLKNCLSVSLAANNHKEGRIYVSTSYALIGLISIFLIFIYLLFYKYINWQSIFNSQSIKESELQKVVSIVYVLFFLKFIADIINVISAAFQITSVSSILLFLSNLGTTLTIWFLSKTTKADMVLLALSLSLIPFIVSISASFYLFRSKFKLVKPSFRFIDFKESGNILSLGSKFFILQIIVVIVFQTDNILIAQFFNPSEVTSFNIAYKYYTIVTILFTIVLTPYWTAFTEAFFNEDFAWIKITIHKLLSYWGFSLVILCGMVFLSGWIIELWLGDTIKIPISLSLSICAYTAVSNWNAIFANFLNGVGKIRIQIYYAIIMGVLNIPLCFLLVKVFHFGTYAMPLSNFICLLIGAVISYIQYNKIVNKQALGIWNK